ncbi:MAG: RNA methyltransferase [Deltaproteobacteria bacterium]|nr:MAG: RNA methyltransferase [Deltaproteobacteria bacterium]
MDRIKLDNISIMLVEPQIPENIGSVARAMNNMGFKRLVVISPANYDISLIMKTATHNSLNILEEMEIEHDFMNAIGSYNYIVGTTARIGKNRPALVTPRMLAKRLASISQENKIAILFGREDKGLSNKQLKCCHTIVHIPTATLTSLNLAQAVMVICYELYLASIDEESALSYVPRLANKFEMEGMYEHLKRALIKIGFIDPKNPEHWMLNIRRMLSRYPLQAKEVQIIRGICRQIEWYSKHAKEKDQSSN